MAVTAGGARTCCLRAHQASALSAGSQSCRWVVHHGQRNEVVRAARACKRAVVGRRACCTAPTRAFATRFVQDICAGQALTHIACTCCQAWQQQGEALALLGFHRMAHFLTQGWPCNRVQVLELEDPSCQVGRRVKVKPPARQLSKSGSGSWFK